METLFTLPLFVLLCLQALISLVLLLPGAVSLPLAALLRKLRKNPASSAVVHTISGALAVLSFAAIFELVRGAERVRASGLRGEVLSTVDFLRAQTSFVLALGNLMLVLLNLALASVKCDLDSTTKNFEAFKRQVRVLSLKQRPGLVHDLLQRSRHCFPYTASNRKLFGKGLNSTAPRLLCADQGTAGCLRGCYWKGW
mgnify:CR=1 FL=1